MLTIKDSVNGKIRKYATNDDELINSLFVSGGTLTPLFKKENRKKAVFFWTDEKSGVYFFKPSELWGKFIKLENGKKFYQYTLDEINYQP